MRFEHAHLLWWLPVLVVGLVAFFWWAWRRKQWLMSQFVQSRLLSQLTVGVSAWRQKVRMGLMVMAMALLLLVIARPQWGFAWEEARQRGLDIIVAVDTSRSMLATDVPPSRLARAKLAAQDLLRLARTDRLGLVAFAGGAFLQCPLTIDDGAFRQSLNALDTSIIPQGGTALAEAIEAARAAFGGEENDNFKILVFFTDGEDHDGRAVEAARAAAEEGLRIFTVGVGTPEGELLSVPGPSGETTFLKDNQGNVVKSRLNEALLREMAEAGRGFYTLLSGANTMDLLYERGLDPLPKAEFAARQVRRYHERYQWFLGVVLLLLMLEMLIPEQKRPTRAAANFEGGSDSLRRSVALLLLLALPVSAWAVSPRSARQLYEKGQYESAYAQYETLLADAPENPRLHFNAGSAAYQVGDLESARRHFQAAMVTKDLALQKNAYYGLGNTLYRMGQAAQEPQETIKAWQSALTHYESASKLDETDEDARFNHEYVKQRLEELQQQQQQNQQGEEGQDENQEKQESEQQEQQEQQEQRENEASSDQQASQEEQEQEQQNQSSSQPEEEQSREGSQSTPNQETNEGEEQQARQGEEEGETSPEQSQPGEQMRPMAMTPQEAKRLLDSLKGEERALIFLPPTMSNRNSPVKRDW